MSSLKIVDTFKRTLSPLSLRTSSHRRLRRSEPLLTLGPDLDEILEDLQLLDDAGLGVQVEVVAGVEHQHGGEADGEVVGVHLVPGGLGRDCGQVVQQVN